MYYTNGLKVSIYADDSPHVDSRVPSWLDWPTTAKKIKSIGRICLQEPLTELQWDLEQNLRYSSTQVRVHACSGFFLQRTLVKTRCSRCRRSRQSRGFSAGRPAAADVLGRLGAWRDWELQLGRQRETDAVRHRPGQPPGDHRGFLHRVKAGPSSVVALSIFRLTGVCWRWSQLILGERAGLECHFCNTETLGSGFAETSKSLSEEQTNMRPHTLFLVKWNILESLHWDRMTHPGWFSIRVGHTWLSVHDWNHEIKQVVSQTWS